MLEISSIHNFVMNSGRRQYDAVFFVNQEQGRAPNPKNDTVGERMGRYSAATLIYGLCLCKIPHFVTYSYREHIDRGTTPRLDPSFPISGLLLYYFMEPGQKRIFNLG
jgi:hypothetical protein